MQLIAYKWIVFSFRNIYYYNYDIFYYILLYALIQVVILCHFYLAIIMCSVSKIAIYILDHHSINHFKLSSIVLIRLWSPNDIEIMRTTGKFDFRILYILNIIFISLFMILFDVIFLIKKYLLYSIIYFLGDIFLGVD